MDGDAQYNQEYFRRAGMRVGRLLDRVSRERLHRGRLSSALDLGAGNLRNACHLRWGVGCERVVAVDIAKPPCLGVLLGEIEFAQSPAEAFVPEPGAFDLILSENLLYFIEPDGVAAIVANALIGLRPGGTLACNLLGPEDWYAQNLNPLSDEGYVRSSFTEGQVVALCRGFETVLVKPHNKKVVGRTRHMWTLVLRRPEH